MCKNKNRLKSEKFKPITRLIAEKAEPNLKSMLCHIENEIPYSVFIIFLSNDADILAMVPKMAKNLLLSYFNKTAHSCCSTLFHCCGYPSK